MNDKSLKITVCCIVLLWMFAVGPAMGGNIDPDASGRKYAFGENTGWWNFRPSEGPGVMVRDGRLEGYAWAENIGWIKFDPANGGVVHDGAGNLSGYAWGQNVGWINFSCHTNATCTTVNYGVSIDLATGVMSGYAWGENTGWIKFNYAGFADPSAHHVQTHWRMNGDISSDGDVDLEDVILGLQVCAGATTATAPHSGSDVGEDGRVGLEEVGYALQHVAGLRTP